MVYPFNLIVVIETYGKPITVKELARISSTSIDTIYRAARRGMYPFYRSGGIIVSSTPPRWGSTTAGCIRRWRLQRTSSLSTIATRRVMRMAGWSGEVA